MNSAHHSLLGIPLKRVNPGAARARAVRGRVGSDPARHAGSRKKSSEHDSFIPIARVCARRVWLRYRSLDHREKHHN